MHKSKVWGQGDFSFFKEVSSTPKAAFIWWTYSNMKYYILKTQILIQF